MAADSTFSTIVAVALVVAAMTAAVGHRRVPTLRDSGGLGAIGTVGTVGMLGTGAIMLGALVMPGFSHFAAASLTIAALFLVLAGAVAVRIRRRRPLGHEQRAAVAVTAVDIAFMAGAMLLMPVHSVSVPLTSAQLGGPHSDGSHLTLAGGLMIWLLLAVWAVCAAVLNAPAILRRSPEGVFQLACSGCMVTAMAAMAV